MTSQMHHIARPAMLSAVWDDYRRPFPGVHLIKPVVLQLLQKVVHFQLLQFLLGNSFAIFLVKSLTLPLIWSKCYLQNSVYDVIKPSSK